MIKSFAKKLVEPDEICDGFLSYNPVMKKLYLHPFNDFDGIASSKSIGKTSYLRYDFCKLGHKYSFLEHNKMWGYLDNVLFSIIGQYVSKDNGIWYHIVIEAMI